MMAMPPVSPRDVVIAIEQLQYRQELHDRLYHTDIYTLSKHHRLVHLILHQCKYVSQLHTVIKEYGIAGDENIHHGNRRRAEILVVDGFIVSLSMLNCCNYQFEEFLGTEGWDELSPINLLIRHIGILSKTIEDVDHMGQTNPLYAIVDSVKIMMTAYYELWKQVGGDFRELVRRIYQRLIDVEKKNIFFEHHDAEMKSLILKGR
ncbi:hypothetical protein D9M68_18090 [compost metagenome]